jgi:two-component sensor histidine kinase
VYADLLVTLGDTILQTRYHTITEASRLAEMTRLRDLALAEMAERKRAEDAILASLQEKEVLLQEIHHRVKNNLQIISGLLRLQSRSIQDAPTLAVLQESQQRVQAMALIHEKLYQSQDFSRVCFAAYVRTLAAELFGVYQVQSGDVRLKTSVDDLPLTVDQAIPCGLILNELLSNCLKHAFPSGKGEIRVEFRLETPRGYLLTVADDGVGVPNHVDFRTTSSLGLRLVRALANQLHGTIDCLCDGGARFELRFPQGPDPQATIRPEAPIDLSTTPDGSAANQEEAGSNLTWPRA